MTIGGAPEYAPRVGGDRSEQFPSSTLQSSALARGEPHAARRSVRLVLVETRAFAWRSHVPPRHYDQTVLLVRGRSEALDTFWQRAAQRAIALQSHGQAIRLTLMLLAPCFDSRASASRLELARALMMQAAELPERASKLVLCAENDSDPKIQANLMAFVDLLMRQPSSWHLPVQVKFGPRSTWQAARSRTGH